MHILIFGPPGSGKGTQAKKISAKHSIPHVSTGDILRQAVKDETALGLKAKAIMEKGELVPDEVMIGIIREMLEKEESKKGFILDGFPRTLPQAEELEKLFNELGYEKPVLLVVEAGDDAVVKRLTSRRACRECGAIFTIDQIEGKDTCSVCGAKNAFYQRDDDREDVIRNRLSVYHQQSQPVIDFMKGKRDIVFIDALKSIEDVEKDIDDKLKPFAVTQ